MFWRYRVPFLQRVCFQVLGVSRGDLPAFPSLSLPPFLPPCLPSSPSLPSSQNLKACPPHPSVVSQRKTRVKLLCCLTCFVDEDGHQCWSDLVCNSSGLWAKAGPMELDFSASLFEARGQIASSSWYGWTVKPRRRSTRVYSAYKTAVNPGQGIGLLIQYHSYMTEVSLYTCKVFVIVVVLNSGEAKAMS